MNKLRKFFSEENRRLAQINCLSRCLAIKFQRLRIYVASSPFALKNSRLLSTKRRWFTHDGDGTTLIPL
jgi:hypothetical protein